MNVEALLRELPAERVLTAGPGYETSRTIWNGAVTSRPAVILRCTDVTDVRTGIRAASKCGVPLSVRGGGHGWTGSALTDGGLTLDLTPMARVTVTGNEAVAQGGATATDLVAAAHEAGLLAVTGSSGAIGVAGLTLGGGYGPFSGHFGLAADNLLGADVVLADGTLVTTDDEHEPELFWALRGGGGNFGVVTALRIRLHTVASIVAGMVVFPFDQAAPVLEGLNDVLLGGPDELTVQAGIFAGPGGQPVVFASPTWSGDEAGATAAIDSITGLGTPLTSQVGPMTPVEVLAQTDGMFPDGRHVEVRPRTVPRLTAPVVETLVRGGTALTSPFSSISLHSVHGAAARLAPTATAFPGRDPHVLIENIAIWECDDGDPHRTWARGLSEELRAEASPSTYVSLLGPDESAQIAAAYGPNTDRLLAAKRRYDPDGLFSASPLPGSNDY